MSIKIVGGLLRGRRFESPRGSNVRPTSEKVREALASILGARGALAGACVVDLYAGSGALGFELLSHGAKRVVFVESDRRVAALVGRNLDVLGLSRQATVLRDNLAASTVSSLLRPHAPFDVVVADPPYADVQSACEVLEALSGQVSEAGLLALEYGIRTPPSAEWRTLAEVASYRYGDTGLLLLRPASPPGD